MLSRRQFVFLTAAALASGSALASNEVPPMLDHILLGINDLDRGVAFVEEHTGVRAAIGGVHPGRGTRNALLSLGERRYLEIVAPDPAQGKVPDFAETLLNMLKAATTPTLVGWSAHLDDIEAFAQKLKYQKINFDGPRLGSRQRPDGRVLKWKSLSLEDDHNGVLPFFIEWDHNSPHPSTDAPAGCQLERFVLADPDPPLLGKLCAQLSLGAPIEKGSASRLIARISGPKGALELSS
jgi:Glyoxalase-like domain